MKPLLLALASVACSVAAQFSFKAGMSALATHSVAPSGAFTRLAQAIFTQPAIMTGFVLYGLGALIWLSVLAQWEVSKAYPLVGLGFIATMLIGYLLGEHVSITRISGALLICAGVVLISRS